MIAAAASESAWRYGVDQVEDSDDMGPGEHSDVLALKEAAAHLAALRRPGNDAHLRDIGIHDASEELLLWAVTQDWAINFYPANDRHRAFESVTGTIHGITVTLFSWRPIPRAPQPTTPVSDEEIGRCSCGAIFYSTDAAHDHSHDEELPF